MNNLTQKRKSGMLKLTSSPKALLIILVLLFVTTALLLLKQRNNVELKEDDTPTVTKSLSYDVNEAPPLPEFFLRKTVSKEEVLDYTWKNHQLIYATNTGIYLLGGENRNLWNNEIDYVNFNNNGQSVFKSNEKWYFYDTHKEKSSVLTSLGENMLISPSGLYISFTNNENLIVEAVISGEIKEYSLKDKGNIQKVMWSDYKDTLVIEIKNAETKTIEVIDKNFKLVYSIPISENTKLLGVNPTGSYIALSQTDTLVLKNLKTSEESHLELNPGTIVSGNWISNDDFILIETVLDQYGRTNDYVSKVDTSANKQLLTTSLPIPYKIDYSKQLKVNPQLNAIPIIENGKGIWILSLVPFTIPQYTPNGITFTPVDQTQLKGDHL